MEIINVYGLEDFISLIFQYSPKQFIDSVLLLLSHFSCVQLFTTPWTAAYQAPPSMGFSRQEYWSRVPLPSPRFSAIQNSNDLFCRSGTASPQIHVELQGILKH